MAATTGFFNGSLLSLFINDSGTSEKMAFLTSKGMDLSTNMIDVTSDDSSGWSVALAGLKSAKFSAEGIVVWDEGSSDQNWDQLYAGFDAGTKFTIRFNSHVSGTPIVGDYYYQADCRIDSLSESAPMYDKVTFSCSFTITGAVTKVINS